MSGKRISLIYFYVISTISLILIIFGIYSTATFVLNTVLYEKYPLKFISEDCENFGYPYRGPVPAEIDKQAQASLSAEERDRLVKSCERRVEEERKLHRIEDIRNSVVFTLVGTVLFVIHFRLARKNSAD